jgi:hypothetical protein
MSYCNIDFFHLVFIFLIKNLHHLMGNLDGLMIFYGHLVEGNGKKWCYYDNYVICFLWCYLFFIVFLSLVRNFFLKFNYVNLILNHFIILQRKLSFILKFCIHYVILYIIFLFCLQTNYYRHIQMIFILNISIF